MAVRPVSVHGEEVPIEPAAVATMVSRFRKTGTISQHHMRMVLLYAHITLYRMITKLILPVLHFEDVRPLAFELEKHKVPLEFGVFFRDGEEAYSSATKKVSLARQLAWNAKRTMPTSDTNDKGVEVSTFVFSMYWWTGEVQFPLPMFGYLSACTEDMKRLVLEALSESVISDMQLC